MLFYIDPGTGSMLFTILIGVLGTVLYFLRNSFMKLRFWITGDRSARYNNNKYPIVIFSDHKRYWNVFEPICDELEKRNQKVLYMSASEDDKAFDKNYTHVKCEYIGEGNKAFSRLNMLNATIVLSTTPSLDVFQWKRSKGVDFYVHIPHAASDISMYRMFGIDYYDAILLSGEYQGKQVRELERLRKLPEKEITYVGIPYMDEMKKRLEGINNKKETDSVTVLLAPSWGSSGILMKYGSELIDKLIATGYKIIIRPHPQSFLSEKEMIDRLMKKYSDEDNLVWNRDNDNFDVLNESDILISDFSGVIFEYSLVFDKPVIYTSNEYDKAPYDCAWIEDEPWTFKTLPLIGHELSEADFDNIKELIDEELSSEVRENNRIKAREETWMYSGEGTTRVVDYLISKLNEIEEDNANEAE